jgi:hypothetical protein
LLMILIRVSIIRGVTHPMLLLRLLHRVLGGRS